MQLSERFDQESLGFLSKLEKVLLSGNMDPVVEQYPELNKNFLEVQLPMFQLQYKYSTSTEAAAILRGLLPEVRGLFSEVEMLVRLLMVVPASSAEAERSFSALRRLKTWLRSTMGQSRLNHVALCHIHQERLDNLEKENICKQFVTANDRRMNVFGAYV